MVCFTDVDIYDNEVTPPIVDISILSQKSKKRGRPKKSEQTQQVTTTYVGPTTRSQAKVHEVSHSLDIFQSDNKSSENTVTNMLTNTVTEGEFPLRSLSLKDKDIWPKIETKPKIEDSKPSNGFTAEDFKPSLPISGPSTAPGYINPPAVFPPASFPELVSPDAVSPRPLSPKVGIREMLQMDTPEPSSFSHIP